MFDTGILVYALAAFFFVGTCRTLRKNFSHTVQKATKKRIYENNSDISTDELLWMIKHFNPSLFHTYCNINTNIIKHAGTLWII